MYVVKFYFFAVSMWMVMTENIKNGNNSEMVLPETFQFETVEDIMSYLEDNFWNPENKPSESITGENSSKIVVIFLFKHSSNVTHRYTICRFQSMLSPKT